MSESDCSDCSDTDFSTWRCDLYVAFANNDPEEVRCLLENESYCEILSDSEWLEMIDLVLENESVDCVSYLEDSIPLTEDHVIRAAYSKQKELLDWVMRRVNPGYGQNPMGSAEIIETILPYMHVDDPDVLKMMLDHWNVVPTQEMLDSTHKSHQVRMHLLLKNYPVLK
jgi:hypothetical protein